MAALAPLAAPLAAIASAASAGVQLLQAQNQAAAMRGQAALGALAARQGELEAQGIELRGRAEAMQVREALYRTLASQNARYAAAGLAIAEGTPGLVAAESETEAERQLDILRTNTDIAAASARLGAAGAAQRARLLAGQAGPVQQLGALGALATAAAGASRIAARQPGSIRTAE